MALKYKEIQVNDLKIQLQKLEKENSDKSDQIDDLNNQVKSLTIEFNKRYVNLNESKKDEKTHQKRIKQLELAIKFEKDEKLKLKRQIQDMNDDLTAANVKSAQIIKLKAYIKELSRKLNSDVYKSTDQLQHESQDKQMKSASSNFEVAPVVVQDVKAKADVVKADVVKDDVKDDVKEQQQQEEALNHQKLLRKRKKLES